MRELTTAELEFISGGNDVEDIIVTGTPYQPPYYYPPSYGYYPSPSGYPGYYPGGGGTYPPPTDNYCQDQEAMQGADEIEAKSDDANKEYGSIVYRAANGQVLHSPPLAGSAEGVTLQAFTNWMTANGVSYSQVMGIVHNHPANIYGLDSTSADVNRYPSANDWNFATHFMNNGAQASFSMYINDTNGTLREFAYADKANYVNLTQQQMDDGYRLPSSTRACGS